MKRIFSIMLIFLLAITTIFPSTISVAAQKKTYADGEYQVQLNVLHATEDKASGMAKYVDNPVSVKIEDGRATANLTLKSSDMIPEFQVESAGKLVNTEIVSENKEENTRVVTFKVEDLDAIINGAVKVDTKNPQFGIMEHAVRLQFDTSEIPLVADKVEAPEESEEPADPAEPGDNEEPSAPGEQEESPEPSNPEDSEPSEPANPSEPQDQEKPSQPEKNSNDESKDPVRYEDGEYEVQLNVLHATEDKSSSMGNYVVNPVAVKIQDGEAAATFTLKSSSMIAGFQVENGGELVDTEIVSENAEENTRVVTFKVEDLDAIINGKVKVDTGNPRFGIMEHTVRLQFDTSEIPVAAEAPEEGEESKEPVRYGDGEYEVQLNVLHATEDKSSSMGNYVVNPVAVKIQDGEAAATFTLKSSSMIAGFQVENDGELVDTGIVSEDEEENTRVVTFKVEDLDAIINGKVKVDTGNPRFGIMEHAVRLQFDTSEIPVAAEEPEEPVKIDLEDGDYSIAFDVLHETEDKRSTAAGYLTSPAKLSVENGKASVTIKLTDNEAIKDFKVEKNGEFISADVVEVNEANNTRVVTFGIGNLQEILNAQVRVHVAQLNYTGEYGMRLVFDEDSIKEGAPAEPEVPEKPEVIEDGKYTINFRVLHATEFEKSKMGEYIKAPAKLLVENGKNIVTFTLTDHEAIQEFSVEQNGELKPAEIVGVNEAENSRDVTFEIDSLDAIVNAKVKVHVEAANYTGEYDVRLFFEENSIRKVEEDTESIIEEVLQLFPKESGFVVSEDGKSISLDLSKQTDTESFKLTPEQAKLLIKYGMTLNLKKNDVQLSIPASIFINGDEPITIDINEIESDPNSLSSTYDLTITQGTRIISQFDEGITLTFNVDISRAKNSNNLKVFYFNEETGKWEKVGGEYNNGKVTAVTKHFSIFTVFEAVDDSEDPKGEDPKGEDPKGEDPKGEDPKGEDPKGEDPKGENPNGASNENLKDKNQTDNPKTADSSKFLLFGFLFMIASVALFVKYRHRFWANKQ